MERDTMTLVPTEESIKLRMAYSFRDLFQYHHDRKHGNMHADMESELESSTSGSADIRE